MARNVFYSFHFDNDFSRTHQVRNMNAFTQNSHPKANEWESLKRTGKEAVRRWIDASLKGTSCTVVLIGSETASRPWVIEEICRSWDAKKGVVGVYIHGLKDLNGNTDNKGLNPFEQVHFHHEGRKIVLSEILADYDPPGWDSKAVYKDIGDN
ncbi:MAG: TIR domain-containing protein, partial [Planctomycetes bacterium]|nr:TIR domain-containing protein [Planctomycetota bacterium]